MKKKLLALLLVVTIAFASCAELMKTLESVTTTIPLTESEVAEGLKEALITGARNSASILGAENGYFGDEMIKILLPEEAHVIVDNISRLPGGEKLMQDVVLSINRAAEDAAREVAPIFVGSIKQMTIGDAFGILKGEDDAATQYLHRTTYNELFNLYSPKIQTSVSKPLIGDISAQDSWDALTGGWNKVANSIAGKIAGFEPVETNLSEYLTNKALDGMFIKVAEEEYKIRTKISARISPLLQKVFGSLDN
ncbi:MAG: DUF4197 domain-containing protein [Bacteroidales bacterium]|nr:DUF4197 domain-containing protein [Bacteroidales bacterium]